ncbi:MAG: sigma-70 family RNA polymerase sigma factor, partial [Phycisphaerae bacterium]
VRAHHAFLRVIVRNEAYRLLAGRGPMASQYFANTDSLQDAPARLLEAADLSAQRAEEQGRLENALRRLPPEQREVIQLKFYEQLTFAQIADILGIPPNTAASRYRYALAHLRELLPM